MECFNCHRKGHYSSNCPHNALFCTERRVDYRGRMSVTRCPVVTRPGVVRSGTVEGHAVDNILLDTGCSRTLVHKKLVPEEKVQDAGAVAIRCAHGDTVLYPLAKTSLVVGGRPIEVEAAISETLPMSVLLGTDIPELPELLQSDRSKKSEVAFAVTTRAAGKKQKKEAEMHHRRQKICGVQPSAIDLHPCTSTDATDERENSSGWMSELDEELFSGGRTRVKLTRREKRAERKRRMELETVIGEDVRDDSDEEEDRNGREDSDDRHELDISSEELKVLQATDSTLGKVRSAAKIRESTVGVGFFYRDGLLFRRWVHSGRNKGDKGQFRNRIHISPI